MAGPEDQEHPEDADGHRDCRQEISRLKEMVRRAGFIFSAMPKDPKIGDWNWPKLAEEFTAEGA